MTAHDYDNGDINDVVVVRERIIQDDGIDWQKRENKYDGNLTMTVHLPATRDSFIMWYIGRISRLFRR